MAVLAYKEVPECILGDRAVRIFLNTKGENDDEVSKGYCG